MATMRAIATWFNARRRLVAYALASWSFLLVIGAGRAPDSDRWIVVSDLGGLLVAALGLLALLGAVLLVYMRPQRQAGLGKRQTHSLRALVIAAMIFVAIAIWIDPAQPPGDEPPAEQAPVASAPLDGLGAGEEPPAGSNDSDVLWLLLIGAISAAVLMRSRHAAPAPPGMDGLAGLSLDEDIGAAIDEASLQLRGGAEPRLAVLAAYATLERTLAERGQPRHVAETPSEHLARALAAVPVLADPAVRLGHLYEIARFSDARVTDDDRLRAGDALAQARRMLATSAGEGP